MQSKEGVLRQQAVSPKLPNIPAPGSSSPVCQSKSGTYQALQEWTRTGVYRRSHIDTRQPSSLLSQQCSLFLQLAIVFHDKDVDGAPLRRDTNAVADKLCLPLQRYGPLHPLTIIRPWLASL